MKIYNKTTNTYPLIAHAQGISHSTKEWLDIVKSNPLTNFNFNDITIVTFVSGNREFSLPNQLNNSNVKYINIVDNVGYWKNTLKIKYLASLEISTKYILCLDAIDVLLVEDMSDILNRYLSFNCDILYNASKLNFPIICKDKEDTNTSFRFLNAGAFIGTTESIIDFYKFLYDNEFNKDYPGSNQSEQIRVRNGRVYYTNYKILVDTECILFQTLNKSQFIFDDDTIIISK